MTLALAEAQRRLGKPGRPRKQAGPARAAAGAAVLPARLLDVQAAAAYLAVSPWTIRDAVAAGTLPRVRIPMKDGEVRRLLFDREDLDALIIRWKDSP